MNHGRCKRNLLEYLEGALPEEEMLQISLHLRDCSSCRRFSEYLAVSLSAMEETRIKEPDPFFYTRISGKLTPGVEPGHRKLMFAHIWQPALISLLLVAAILGGIGIGGIGKEKNFDRYAMENIDPWLNEMNSEPIESFLVEF